MAERQVAHTLETRLGKLAVDMERVIRFPRGIIGFEDCKEFTLLQIQDDSPFLVLQSLTRPELGLMMADPYCFMSDYTVKIGSAEQKILNIEDVQQIAILVSVTIPKGKPEETALNLMGPVLINHAERIGLQVPQVDSKYPPKFFVREAMEKAAETLEPVKSASGE